MNDHERRLLVAMAIELHKTPRELEELTQEEFAELLAGFKFRAEELKRGME